MLEIDDELDLEEEAKFDIFAYIEARGLNFPTFNKPKAKEFPQIIV